VKYQKKSNKDISIVHGAAANMLGEPLSKKNYGGAFVTALPDIYCRGKKGKKTNHEVKIKTKIKNANCFC
jgi:hypothetical protein